MYQGQKQALGVQVFMKEILVEMILTPTILIRLNLEIEMEDGSILDFRDEIEAVINFWKRYFRNDLYL